MPEKTKSAGTRKIAEVTLTPHVQDYELLARRIKELNSKLQEIKSIVNEINNIELSIEIHQQLQ